MRLCLIFVLLCGFIRPVESSEVAINAAILASITQIAQWAQPNTVLQKYGIEQNQDHETTTPSPKKRSISSPLASEDGATSESDSSVSEDFEGFLVVRSESFQRFGAQSTPPATIRNRLGAQSMPPTTESTDSIIWPSSPHKCERPHSAELRAHSLGTPDKKK